MLHPISLSPGDKNCFYGYSYFGNGLYGNSLIYLANTGLKLWGARSRCVCVCVCVCVLSCPTGSTEDEAADPMMQ